MLNIQNKKVVFVVSLLIALVTFSVGTFLSERFNIGAANPTTRTITVTKQWYDDDNSAGERPSDITAYIKRKSSTLIAGKDLNVKMKSLAGTSASSYNPNDNITAFKMATEAQYNAAKDSLTANNEIQASGDKTYMWFDNGTIYIYSETNVIFAGANFAETFRKLSSLVDISGAAYIDTTFVTDMNRMFQDSYSLKDLAPLANWQTGSVTDMTFMFGGNTGGGDSCLVDMQIEKLDPLVNWDVSSVTQMYQMFKCNKGYKSISSLSNWDVANVVSMAQMFNQATVTDASGIENWDVRRVKGNSSTVLDSDNGFYKLFYGAPVDNDLTGSINWFTQRAGRWVFDAANSKSYYLPDSGPISGTAPTSPMIDAGDLHTCNASTNTWQKSGNTWTCTITVANDGASYIAWEDPVRGYLGTNYVNNPADVINGAVTIDNDYLNGPKITVKKLVTGAAGSQTESFNFTLNAYDEHGNPSVGLSHTFTLKHNETSAAFTLPVGYSYSVTESTNGYDPAYNIVNNSDSSMVSSGSTSTTNIITPAHDQTVTFSNHKDSPIFSKIIVTKQWSGDENFAVLRPDSITAYLNKTVSYLPAGSSLRSTMVSRAGSANNIQKILKATDAECSTNKSSANEIQASGEKTYMWYNSNAIYICSDADNVYANANMQAAFSNFPNLTDISGLEIFNTTYTTNMAGMFRDSLAITSLDALSKWDTSNVTSMRVMFFSNDTSKYFAFTNFNGLRNWDTQKVTDMNQMFKGTGNVTSVEPISNWNVKNVADMNQMFNRTGANAGGITDIDTLAKWSPIRVGSSYKNVLVPSANPTGSFSNMLNNTGLPVSSLPIFTGRAGTWSNTGYTYNPSSGPAASPANTYTKSETANQQVCTGTTTTGEYNKWSRDDTNNKWVCIVEVSSDNSKYSVWEDPVTNYTGSALAANPVKNVTDSATITNKLNAYKITLKKKITGNLADINKKFDFNIKLYDAGGVEVAGYSTIKTLGQNETITFPVPWGYAYEVAETDTDYKEFYRITKTADGAVVADTTESVSTNKITPAEDQMVTFTNNKEDNVITGVFGSGRSFVVMIVIGIGSLSLFTVLSLTAKLRRKVKDG